MDLSHDRVGLEHWELTPLERSERVLRRLNRSLRDARLNGWQAFLGEDGHLYIRLSARQADVGSGELDERLQGCQLEHWPTEGQLDFFDADAGWFPPSS